VGELGDLDAGDANLSAHGAAVPSGAGGAPSFTR
jgi:hypothetical protein